MSKRVGSLWHVLLTVYPGKMQLFRGGAVGAAQARDGQQPTRWVHSVGCEHTAAFPTVGNKRVRALQVTGRRDFFNFQTASLFFQDFF